MESTRGVAASGLCTRGSWFLSAGRHRKAAISSGSGPVLVDEAAEHVMSDDLALVAHRLGKRLFGYPLSGTHAGQAALGGWAKPAAAEQLDQLIRVRHSLPAGHGLDPQSGRGTRALAISRPVIALLPKPRDGHQTRSKRSRFMTLFHVATKSRTNLSFESSDA